MNIELREHEIYEIIRDTCDELGVGILATCDEATGGAGMHFMHRYDLGAGLRKRQRWRVLQAMVVHAIAGSALTIAVINYGNIATAVVGGLLFGWAVNTFFSAMRTIDEPAITLGQLEHHIALALTSRGYCVELRDGQLSVWWREIT